MLVDAHRLPPDTVLRAQVCVIGSGAAGITAAIELDRRGVGVLLLDAGGTGGAAAADSLRGSVDGEHPPLEWTRQKRLGGATNHWGGRCAPLSPEDFERRPHVPGSGWPVSYDDLVPYYRRAHAICALGAFEYGVPDALPDAPPFLLDGRPSDRLLDDRLWRWSPPVRFWPRFGPELERSRTTTVCRHANVVRLERDPLSGAVTGVVLAAAPGRIHRVETGVVILAVGGLETARVLLASNEDSPRGLGNEHDLVGRHYMTHPVVEVGRVTFAGAAPWPALRYERSHDGVYCRRMLMLTPEEQRRRATPNAAIAFWYPDPVDPRHRDPLLSAFALTKLAQVRGRITWRTRVVTRQLPRAADVPRHLGNVVAGLPQVAGFATRWGRQRWLEPRAVPSFLPERVATAFRLRVDAEQSPDPENRVVLGRARDAFGVPRLRVRYRVSDDDRAAVVRSLHVVREELQRRGLGSVELPPEGDALAGVEISDGTHQIGLTRMASSPRRGVVDADCAVHGAANLYVTGSSVFPTSGAVGPTLTIVALAVRVADTVVAALARRPLDVADGAGGTLPAAAGAAQIDRVSPERSP